MKRIKNMRELVLMQEKLKFQEKFVEKELVESSANILDNLSDKIKDLAYDLGTNLTMQIISSFRKRKSSKDSTDS
ncbi:hypothetical protein GM418_01090 [Maribellus comscasis]|uniref:Uncharacterized protein n=1 Tax=Maribellus comscasis TaxID=2681766 RepID=A0A6I6JMU7_9BACT|nr:hypothetical protein [Maribellus comscasis]QGY42300.1 hypothetical protein GM418_01090 [Maribellus comscasis]